MNNPEDRTRHDLKKSKSYEILRAERAHPKAWQPRQIPKEVLAMPQPTAFSLWPKHDKHGR